MALGHWLKDYIGPHSGGSGGGGGGGALFIRYDHYDEETSIAWYDKTWKQVRDAIDSDVPCYLITDMRATSPHGAVVISQVFQFYSSDEEYSVYYLYAEDTGSGGEIQLYSTKLNADSADGYLYVED